MSRRLLVADLFCGAGGSSTGARRALEALGIRMQLVAVNHWPVAIETHQRNHPDARHLCSDVYRLSPREAIPEGRLDLLMASPTCTFFSRARGGRPTSREQRWGRMTPTQVVRWCSEIDVRCLVVENVPEFADWGPNDADGRRRREKRGTYFRAWMKKLGRLGYRCEWRVLNAADYGDATTRSRFFLVGRKDGEPIHWPAPTHSCDGQGDLYGGAERWRPASDVIDWSIRGTSIFTRRKPLRPKTLARIYTGLIRFDWPEPFVARLREHMAEVGAPIPVLDIPRRHSAGPFVVPQHGGGEARHVVEPMSTIATKGAHALVVPYYGTASARPADRPLPTVTTRDRFAFVTPVTHADASNRSRGLDRPLPTITAAARGELAFITASFGERPGQTPRVHPLSEPVPTICATGTIPLIEPGDCDVLYRMLQPHELAAAMGLEGYEFSGTKTEVTRQIGNAVAAGTAAALVGALFGPRGARVAS